MTYGPAPVPEPGVGDLWVRACFYSYKDHNFCDLSVFTVESQRFLFFFVNLLNVSFIWKICDNVKKLNEHEYIFGLFFFTQDVNFITSIELKYNF